MFKLEIENYLGDRLRIVNDVNFVVTGISGLNPPSASITTSVIAASDGERLNNARLEKRNLVLTMRILTDVERNRILLYRYFKVKRRCKIYYKNQSRDVYIEGYVETFEDDFFTQLQTVQISILCPQPYFKAIEDICYDISQVLDRFEFPFAIESSGMEVSVLDTTLIGKVTNHGDVETGTTIEINATGEVVNPKIYNTSTRGMFGLNIIMILGDLIRITTIKGQKKVELIRGAQTTNIINQLMANPDWFQLEIGDNYFTYDCESGNEFFNMQFKHTDMYEGV